MTEIFGVIGHPIKHSLSPVMHNAAFKHLNYDGIYLAFEVRSEELESALNGARALGIGGLNITIPHKERTAEILTPDRAVEEIGACNTADLRKWRCYNTDVHGVLMALKEAGIDTKGIRVLVVGAGGAGKACIYALRDAGEVFVTNRTAERGREVARRFGVEFIEIERLATQRFDLIVNATPIGIKGFPDTLPVPEEVVRRSSAVFDMVYNPPETRLVRVGRKYGCRIASGVDMLVHQGAKAFEIFTGLKAPVDVMKRAVVSELEKLA
ncbi:MAG: shikimate dehydrogenase [Archaeoglobi archaeon]|nr:shikimate dehydrogenase [Archaeoglobi archaeon]